MSSNNDTSIIEIIDLSSKEMELLKALRNVWRYGEVVIQMRDGQPYRLRRVVEFLDLESDIKPVDKSKKKDLIRVQSMS